MKRLELSKVHVTATSMLKKIFLILMAAGLLASSFATVTFADTVPPAGTPATVSADPLPTVQIDGVVWDQVTVGNKVYVTGKFSTARPAGVALGGAGSVTRAGLLAYDITTGQLDTSFVHSLGGTSGTPCTGSVATGPQGCAIAASPDGTRLYIGGTFSTVDGQPRANLAAFNLTNNTLLPGFLGLNNKVKALAATNSGVYVGGPFTAVGSTPRGHLAYFNANGSLNTAWNATVSGQVNGMVVARNKLIFAGSFAAVNGTKFWSNAAVSLTTGASITPWASQSDSFPVRNVDPLNQSRTGYTSVSTDGTQVYLTSFTYIGPAAERVKTFEGRMALNADNGALVWMNDCVGDSYDSFPIGQVLYSASHTHGCAPRDFMADYFGKVRTYYHAMAETIYATGTNTTTNGGAYPSYVGQPGSTILTWSPTFSLGSSTGAYQAGWSVTGNANYLSYAGEFPRVNGVAQQGIVRFALKDLAPNDLGPLPYRGGNIAIAASPANTSRQSLVKVYGTGDPDNGLLTYEVYQRGGSTLLASKTMDSRFWKTGLNWSFTDTNIPTGQTGSYKLVVKDPFGNALTLNNPTVADDTDTRITYAGTWTSSQNRGGTLPDFGKGIHYTSAAGASFSFSFYGSAIDLYSEKNSDRGTASVTIDGVSAGTYSAANNGLLFQQKVFSKTGLGFGKHTITVKNVTAGKYLDLDAIYVNQDSVVDDTSISGVSYRTPTNWIVRTTATTNYGQSLHYTTVNGEYATFTFTGTSVALMTEKNSDRGNMAISIDGGTPVTVSTHHTSSLRQQIVFTKTGLTNSTHTIRITKLTGTYMDVDAVFSR